MKKITQTMYVYAISYDDGDTAIKVSDVGGMEVAGWHFINSFDMSTEIEDIDYSDLAKQARIDAELAKQARLEA